MRAIVTDQAVAAVHAYFSARGEDPTVITPAFFLYHLSHGKTADQIFRIAVGQLDDHGYGHGV